MKILSLKLDDDTFGETEKITSKLKTASNRYINAALNFYNLFGERILFINQISKEFNAIKTDSLEI